jgi:N-acetylmuramoyl-L-alanine amidase
MRTIFSRKNELRLKYEILQSIYEENLDIIGKKKDSRLIRRNPLFSRKFLFSCLLALVAVFFHVNTIFFPEKELTAGLISENVRGIPVKASVSTEEALSAYKAFSSAKDSSLSRMFGLGVKTIMIDAGHGGNDPGTIGKLGTKEKDLTLDIARRLKERLLRSGQFRVLMTRDEDIAVPLNERVRLTQTARADLFISIHLNYLPSRPINIIETYYFGPSADDKTIRLAERENAGSEYAISDFRDMIEKIGQTLKLQESRDLAMSIQKNLFLNSKKANNDIYDFGVKRAPFVVLLGAEVPAVLAEVSCLSNIQEEKELNTEKHRENIARYLEAGILDYLNKGDFTHEAKK